MDDVKSSSLPILALVKDLMFASRITAMARAAGTSVTLVRDPAKLADMPGRLLLVDLNLPGAIEAAAAWRQRCDAEVVGFVSHVDAETIARARAAGIPRVLARSGFVEVLEQLVSPQPDLGGTDTPQ
jgi:DNA-binding NarL/FixJ family response regulator